MKQHSIRNDKMKRNVSYRSMRIVYPLTTGFDRILRVAICCNRGTSAYTGNYFICFCGSLSLLWVSLTRFLASKNDNGDEK